MMGDDSSSDEDDAEAKNRTRGAETSSVTWGMRECGFVRALRETFISAYV